MSLLQAIFMGLIQGLTEFLPVSSSGHLALFKILFHVETDTGILFDVLLHLGTLAAICIVYYKDIARLFLEGAAIAKDVFINIGIFFKNLGQDNKKPYLRIVCNSYRKLVMLVLVSTIPTGVIGYLGREVVASAAGVLLVPGICLLVTAVLLFLADRMPEGKKLPKNVSYTTAFGIGIAQGIATLPGLSRSGTTMTVCLANGFRQSFAVKYSFIMSIPAVLGAAVLEISDITTAGLTAAEIVSYLVGMAVAAVVGYFCIKAMLVVVRTRKFKIFGVYCLMVGLLSVIGYFVSA